MQTIEVYDKKGDTLRNLVQWDNNVYIYIKHSEITSAHDVHFFNEDSDEAYVVESEFKSSALVAKIPNVLLTTGLTVFGYVVVTDEDEEKSLYGFRIPVRKKPRPGDRFYKDTDDYIRVEEAIEECKEYARQAGESASNAQTYKNEAEASAGKAAKSEENAAKSETAAKGSAAEALQSQQSAQSSKEDAANSAAAALKSEQAASRSETAAGESAGRADAAAQSAMESKTAAEEAKQSALDSKEAASTSQAAALESEKKAKKSQDAAALSQQAAADSEANAETYKNDAAGSAQTASDAAQTATKAKDDALASQQAAALSETNAKDYATKAQSYAEGGTSTRPGEDEDNAQYYWEQSKQHAENVERLAGEVQSNAEAAQTAAQTATESAESASTDAQTVADAKDAAQQAEQKATAAADKAQTAADNLTALLDDALNDRLLSSNFTVTIPTEGWAENAVTVACGGLLDTDNPFIDIVLTGTAETDKAMTEAWNNITYIETGDGQLFVHARAVPSVELPIAVKVVR